MNRELYRYHFAATAPMRDVEQSLLLAVLATECLHGRSLVRLDASFCLDNDKRSCVVPPNEKAVFGYLPESFGMCRLRCAVLGQNLTHPFRSDAY